MLQYLVFSLCLSSRFLPLSLSDSSSHSLSFVLASLFLFLHILHLSLSFLFLLFANSLPFILFPSRAFIYNFTRYMCLSWFEVDDKTGQSQTTKSSIFSTCCSHSLHVGSASFFFVFFLLRFAYRPVDTTHRDFEQEYRYSSCFLFRIWLPVLSEDFSRVECVTRPEGNLGPPARLCTALIKTCQHMVHIRL